MYRERIDLLRKAMKEEGIDFYIIPTADFHNSEYVSDYFKVREFFSGFTGSNGTLVVSENVAGLWTDGRYFIQAEKELEGSGITLFKMQEEGVPTIEDYLLKNMSANGTLGFDGRVVDANYGLRLEKSLEKKKISIKFDFDFAESIWKNRPQIPCNMLFVLPFHYCGKTVEEKLNDVRKEMEEKETEFYFLSKLDDLMWLFNVRGKDVECNPVALSFAFITKNNAVIFLQKNAITKEIEAYFESYHVEIREYLEVYSYLSQNTLKGDMLLDKRNINYTTYKILHENFAITDSTNPTELMKAKKNPVEMQHMRETYLADSAAVTKFIYWLKKNIGKEEITELSAAEYLDHLRSQIPGFVMLSFPTISAYEENAAMMHYEATPKNHKVLDQKGMLLVDSGGQYYGGTTDVTRTIVLGNISEEVKKHYSLTTAGMLSLAAARFLYGCSGRNLDILARQPLWNEGIDYKCGTGHGVGYCLNVHEGPQNIRWKYLSPMVEAVLEEGMVVTDEPGVYIKDSHGIRIENVMVVKNYVKNSDGQFMEFEMLTYAPIDLEAIDIRYLNEKQRNLLNTYHAMVYEKISPFLSKEEKEWLEEVTAAV